MKTLLSGRRTKAAPHPEPVEETPEARRSRLQRDDAQDRAQVMALAQDLANRIAQRQAELDALAERERQAELASQDEALRTREAAQLAWRDVKGRELRQELAALEDRFQNSWKTGENGNSLREPMRQLREQITKLNNEVRIIENRLADPEFRASHPPVVDPASEPEFVDREKEAFVHRMQHPWLYGYGPLNKETWERAGKQRQGHCPVHDPKTVRPVAIHVE